MSQPPAAARAEGYAGDVTPEATFAGLAADEEAVLVDCRTRAEWNYVGVPDLTSLGKPVIYLEWLNYPEGAVDPEFVDKLTEHGVPRHAPVYFLCRSGVRSISAARAATDSAYEAAYNVLEGFEGPIGSGGIRDVSGWKLAGLPWKQS